MDDAVQQAGVGGKRLWLTGHSLGGALATITAAEWVDQHPVTGIYTFGQPKAVGARPARLLRQRYQERFHRFVNDDDIVPGAPPGYRHVGRLFWFDAQGGLQAFDADTESLEASNQPNELSASELEELQARIGDLKNATDIDLATGRAGTEAQESPEGLAAHRQAVFDASVEGLVPGVRDHGIERYIAQIRRQIERPVEVDEAIARAISETRADAFGLERGAPRD